MAPNRPRKIFLDANVIIRAGKPPGAPLIPRVVDLAEAGYVKVVTTDLTKMEIAKKHAANDFEAIGGLARKRVRQLVNDILGVALPPVSAAELHQKLFDNYSDSVERMFRTLRVETLSIDSIKPSVVFDAYARKTGLFSDDAKKDQFPDAFIFEALKAVASDSDPLTIISDDKDFIAASRNAKNVSVIKSIPDLFAELGLRIDAAPDVQQFIHNNLDQIIAKVDDELNQWGLQVDDIDDAEVDEATVEGVQFDDFRTFRTTGAGNDILVVGDIEMDVKVSYHHPDWDSATYDSEDKVLLPHHTVEGERNVDVHANFSMTLMVDQSGKPNSIAAFSFNDDNFVWVSLTPSDLDYK